MNIKLYFVKIPWNKSYLFPSHFVLILIVSQNQKLNCFISNDVWQLKQLPESGEKQQVLTGIAVESGRAKSSWTIKAPQTSHCRNPTDWSCTSGGLQRRDPGSISIQQDFIPSGSWVWLLLWFCCMLISDLRSEILEREINLTSPVVILWKVTSTLEWCLASQFWSAGTVYDGTFEQKALPGLGFDKAILLPSSHSFPYVVNFVSFPIFNCSCQLITTEFYVSSWNCILFWCWIHLWGFPEEQIRKGTTLCF